MDYKSEINTIKQDISYLKTQSEAFHAALCAKTDELDDMVHESINKAHAVQIQQNSLFLYLKEIETKVKDVKNIFNSI